MYSSVNMPFYFTWYKILVVHTVPPVCEKVEWTEVGIKHKEIIPDCLKDIHFLFKGIIWCFNCFTCNTHLNWPVIRLCTSTKFEQSLIWKVVFGFRGVNVRGTYLTRQAGQNVNEEVNEEPCMFLLFVWEVSEIAISRLTSLQLLFQQKLPKFICLFLHCSYTMILGYLNVRVLTYCSKVFVILSKKLASIRVRVKNQGPIS